VLTPRQTELAALPELLTVAEAAAALRCNARTINRMVARGDLAKNGKSKRHSKILKSSLLVCIVTHGDSVPACDYASPAHDVSIAAQYEDAPESDEAQPVPEYLTEDAGFAAECKRFADMLPPVERRFLHQHPAPSDITATQSPAEAGFQELTPYGV
jgi:hypothetical protein